MKTSIGIIPLIGIILGVLKVCGLVAISWWWIALMVFIAPVIVTVFLLAAALVLGLASSFR